MDNELKVFHSLINDVWKLIKESINIQNTDKDWEEFLSLANSCVNNPMYDPIQNMAIQWILAYEKYLEEKQGNGRTYKDKHNQ